MTVLQLLTLLLRYPEDSEVTFTDGAGSFYPVESALYDDKSDTVRLSAEPVHVADEFSYRPLMSE